MSMQPLTLKKTCDMCTKSKVKCSGGYPCTRCDAKGIQCFYSPRKKRGAPKKDQDIAAFSRQGPIVTRSSVDTRAKGALGSLADHERRSWSVFFTLYKHYGTSCSLYWFNRQLKKIQSVLKKRGDKEALGRLNTWMDAISIDIDALTRKMDKCKLAMMQKAVIHPPGSVALWGIQGTVKDPDEKQLRAVFEEKKNSKTPFIKIRTKFLEKDVEGVEIECNEAFTLVFGHTAENLQKELNWTGGGLLPWGGDIIGRILTREKDLLAFVQILAIKFNSFGPPKEIPMVREIPSCHMMEVEIKDNPTNGKKVSVNCLIKCVHREVLKLEGSTLDISVDLTPLAPHDHLLDPEKITSVVELERPIDMYASMKRRADDEEVEEVEAESSKKAKDMSEEQPQVVHEPVVIPDIEPLEEEIKSNMLNQFSGEEFKKPTDENKQFLKTKSVSLSEIDGFLEGDMPASTEQQYLNNFEDTEKSQAIDDALEEFVGDGTEEEYNLEGDWFEGLLDWSAQTTVPDQYRPAKVFQHLEQEGF